jgi:phage gp37-like protein
MLQTPPAVFVAILANTHNISPSFALKRTRVTALFHKLQDARDDAEINAILDGVGSSH